MSLALSNCCGAVQWGETDLCSNCYEHAEFLTDEEWEARDPGYPHSHLPKDQRPSYVVVTPPPTYIHVSNLTEEQARIWLMHNDSEHAVEWSKAEAGGLVRAVADNLYQFGDDPQEGQIRVVTGNAKRIRLKKE